MITQQQCLDLFDYRNGKLYWKTALSNRVQIGREAGYIDKDGYRVVRVNRKNYFSHRLIFLMKKGYIPECLDHINGNPIDNRIENLRVANKNENSHNCKRRKDNTSGYKNVVWAKTKNKWRVVVKINSVNKHIGYFNNIEEANKAAISARNTLHKEFARHE